MNKAVVFCIFLVACRTQHVRQQPAPPEALNRIQAAESQAYALATSLCDATGPRFSGSPGNALGVTWAVETMKSLGLENVHTEPVMVPHWVRGSEEARITSPLAQPLSITALGHTVSTPEAGVEAEVFEVNSLDDLKALQPGSVAGKLLFANVVMHKAADGSGYGAVSSVRRIVAKKAIECGAVGALIRSVGSDNNRLAHTGAQGDDPGKLATAALSVPDAELLHRLVAKGPTRVFMKLVAREEAPVESANVIGEVRGREKPDEVILFGAHLDSWDLGTGALDDGAGVGIALDVARLLKSLPERPRRTLRVVLFANEEDGLGGAKAYGKAHADELAKHVLSIEADAGGDRARTVRLLARDEAKEPFISWGPWLAGLGVNMEGDSAEGGADTSILRAAGVPQLDVRQDASRYFDYHHTANDTVDKIDAVQITQAARTFAAVTWLAAEQQVDFGRIAEGDRERRRK